MEEDRGQIVAGNTGPAVQHQITLSIRSKAGRHRSTAGEFIRREAHDRHLLERTIPVHGQQLDLHPAIFQRGHQNQVLIASARDIFHEVLLIGLFENGGELPILIGVNRQIVVPLGGHIAHHQLGGTSCL